MIRCKKCCIEFVFCICEETKKQNMPNISIPPPKDFTYVFTPATEPPVTSRQYSIDKAIQEAVLKERETCAKLCEDVGSITGELLWEYFGEYFGELIRDRSIGE